MKKQDYFEEFERTEDGQIIQVHPMRFESLDCEYRIKEISIV